jgi:hypothetical protein
VIHQGGSGSIIALTNLAVYYVESGDLARGGIASPAGRHAQRLGDEGGTRW